jgi:peptidoglycan lytic transglycosylase
VVNRERLSLSVLLIVFSLLSACGTLHRGDGPPRSGSNIPRDLPGDAIPRDEPRSRYGNRPYYEVKGKTYKVLDTSLNYQERGVASWYGKKFHGRMTSSQERYDMYAMTAAHRSLPLPTYVRVRNLKNNRSVIVRVNDRGPFIDNRLIDLSYAAATKLDLVRAGTGLVEVTAISFDKPVPHVARPATVAMAAEEPNEKIFVQVGAFGDVANARRRFAMLRNGGIGSAFVDKDNSASPTIYRVRIGPIADVNQYDSIVEELQRLGVRDTHLVTE